MKDIYDLMGRIFISMIFLYEILDSLFFFQHTVETMEKYGITWYPNLILILALIFLILGTTMVLIGYYANYGAFLLLLYWVPFTLIVYSFWNDAPETQRMTAVYFMRNIAICGGLLLLMANAAGKYSVRRLLHTLRLPK